MANIISQYSFADYGVIEILGDLERFLLALLGMDDEALMRRLEARRGKGRNDYPVRVMWNLIIAMKVFGHRTIASFRRELKRNSQLRKICGLEDFGRKKHLVPPARVFSGFLKLLAEEQAEIDVMFDSMVLELTEKLPEFGKNTAGDGKYLDGEATKQYKDTDIVYDYKGNVYIFDNKGVQRRMHYEGYDRQKKCLRYSYKGKTYKIYISYDERVFLPVARDSMKYERLYKGRTSVERLNGRIDRDYMFEDHCIRGLKKMKLMVSLTLLTMNAMALGKINQGVTKHLAALTRLDMPCAG